MQKLKILWIVFVKLALLNIINLVYLYILYKKPKNKKERHVIFFRHVIRSCLSINDLLEINPDNFVSLKW